MEGLRDFNEMTIEEHIEYLEQKFRYGSTGTAKSVNELIKAYRNKPPLLK